MVQPSAKFPENPSQDPGVSEAPEPWVGSVGFSGEIWNMSPIAVTMAKILKEFPPSSSSLAGTARTEEPALLESHGLQ